MARVLIVVPPLVGHINPLHGVATELAARGHTVAWAGPPELIGASAHVYPAVAEPGPPRPPQLRSFAALRHLWEQVLVPLAEQMLDGVESAVRGFRPDLLLCDQQAMAGPLVAESHGLPWATSASTSAELTDPLATLPKLAGWVRDRQAELCRHAGLTLPEGADLRFSPQLVLAFTVVELAGPTTRPGVRFVGPSLARPSRVGDFPVERLDPARPLVLVTLGTVNGDAAARFLTEAFAGCAAETSRFQTVVADPTGRLPRRPDGPVVVGHIPLLELLGRAAAVVCHGGHNTVVESLAFAVPVAVAPIRDDQPIVADQVVRTGAGLRLRFDRATGPDVAAACRRLLDDAAGHRAAAAAVAAALAAAGGATTAVDAVEALLAAGQPMARTTWR